MVFQQQAAHPLAGGIAAAVLAAAAPAGADTGSANVEEVQGIDEPRPVGVADGSFVFAPMPSSSPAIGTGLALAMSWIYLADEQSDPSKLFTGIFKTDNGSHGLVGGGAFNFHQNKYRLKAVGGHFEIYYDLNVNGVQVPIQQDNEVGRLEGGYRLSDEFLAGGFYRWRNNTTKPDDVELPDALLDQLAMTINEVGGFLEWDRRNEVFTPSSGAFGTLSVSHATADGIIDRDYWHTIATLAGYHELPGGVGAGYIVACSSGAEAPFFDQCGIGAVDNFRGYASGQVYDEQLLSFQGEYRGRINQRFGYVLFGGFGGVGSGFGNVFDDVKSAAGGGMRFRLSKKFNVDYAADIAVNDEGDTNFYVTVGQRF